ncbi:MAG: hypothetical protein ACI9E5_000738 [Candidatus Omnitrophota bacterium]|jgi:hypothetical protein
MDKVRVEQVPEGVVVDRTWLKNKGMSASLVDYYIKRGYLESVARGVYRRPGGMLKWQHLVYSLQILGFSLHVGGRSALELKGRAHYLPLGGKEKIHLYCQKKLPRWLFKINVNVEFVEHSRAIFQGHSKLGVSNVLFGSWDWEINVSSPERALFEMMADVPKKETFHMVDVVIEGAVTLRPDLINSLLVNCKNIKVKRLFLWFAQKYYHQWFENVNLEQVDLGKGKRVVQENGKLDSKYLITVPRDSDDREEQSIF